MKFIIFIGIFVFILLLIYQFARDRAGKRQQNPGEKTHKQTSILHGRGATAAEGHAPRPLYDHELKPPNARPE